MNIDEDYGVADLSDEKPRKSPKFSYRAFCNCGWSIASRHATNAYVGTTFYHGRWCPACGNPGPAPCSNLWKVKKVVWKSQASLFNPFSWGKGEWVPID